MKRRDATRQLSSYFYRASKARFSYGVMDCCQFACGAIEAQTGINPGAGLVYEGRAQAIRLIRGFGSFEQMVAELLAKHGFQKLPTAKFAQGGDVAIVRHQGKLIMGTVSLRGTHVVVKAWQGLKLIPLSDAEAAWRV